MSDNQREERAGGFEAGEASPGGGEVADTWPIRDEAPGGEEVVDGLPVDAATGGRPVAGDRLPAVPEPVGIAVSRPAQVPAVQAAALAATGFVAGAATIAVFGRRRGGLLRGGRRRRGGWLGRRRKGAVGEIVASNSFLVDVHLLRRD